MKNSNFQNDDKIARAEDILHTVSGDVAVLMSMTTGKFVELNEVGRAIWLLTDGQKTIEMVSDALQETYNVSAEDCISQLREFYADLEASDLIVNLGSADG